MTRLGMISLLALLGVAPEAAAQHQHMHSPYVGLEDRPIKALSDSQVQQLQNGDGMAFAFALPAELNHYPGPRHVFDLSQPLALSRRQQSQVRLVEQGMRTKARQLGTAIIEKERVLDQGFARKTLDEAALRELTGEIARPQGDLRYVHLAAHLEVRRILTEKQVKSYDELGGYSKAASPR